MHRRLVLTVQDGGEVEKSDMLVLPQAAEDAIRDWLTRRGKKAGVQFTILSNRSAAAFAVPPGNLISRQGQQTCLHLAAGTGDEALEIGVLPDQIAQPSGVSFPCPTDLASVRHGAARTSIGTRTKHWGRSPQMRPFHAAEATQSPREHLSVARLKGTLMRTILRSLECCLFGGKPS